MAKKRSSEDISGSTFADLYDVQEELNRKGARPMGRPRNKIQRKPTTIYLTKEETTTLRRLHLMMSENVSSVNRSQIVGLALELMADLINAHDEDDDFFDDARTLDSIRRKLKGLLV